MVVEFITNLSDELSNVKESEIPEEKLGGDNSIDPCDTNWLSVYFVPTWLYFYLNNGNIDIFVMSVNLLFIAPSVIGAS